MSIKALLLDREREVFPLLGDIFNVTGHKLLIAANDNMYRDLISSTDIDIVILNHTDIKSWFESWTGERATLPFFLVDREEEEKRLLNMGFSELNFVRKPFNPLELLNKLSYLHKLDPFEEAHQLGLINTVVKLSNLKESRVVEVSNGNSCNILIRDGVLDGMDCTLEELRSVLESDNPIVKVKEFKEIELEQKFGSTLEFVKTLIEKTKPVKVVLSEGEKIVKELEPVEEIEEGLYRVSKFASVPVLLKNVYLRIYEGRDKKVAFLINAGSLDEWSGVRNLVEDVLFNMNELDAVILLTGDLSSVYNTFIMVEQKVNVQFITDYSVKRGLAESGCKSGRIRTFEDFPSYSVTVATGHRLRFVPVSFSPSLGGFCLYEEDTGYLFTPEFLSSFFNEKEEDPIDEVKLYHRVYMPSGGVLNSLVGRVSDLNVSRVFPRYGRPYGNFARTLTELSGMRTGIDYGPVSEKEKALEVLSSVVNFVLNNEEKGVSDRFLEELGRFATVENGNVTDVYVEPPFTVELLLNATMMVPGIKPSTVVGVLKKLDEAGVFINPF